MLADKRTLRLGESIGVTGLVNVVWKKTKDEWRIGEWHTAHLEIQTASQTAFSEVTGKVMDGHLFNALTQSEQEKHILKYLQTDEAPFGFSLSSANSKPGVSIVDINRDGFDDIYVYASWGKNKMLLNQPGSGFVDVASELGLDVENNTTSAIFADFDNDGDDDVFLARFSAPCMYLENEKGKFVDRSREIGIELPCLATSLSAADYDGDGLLDLFISTSASYQISNEIESLPPSKTASQFILAQLSNGTFCLPGKLLADFLPDDEAKIVSDLVWKNIKNQVTDQYGPRSRLLRNLGANRFQYSEAIPRVYRNTLQGTWSDYDNDGDPDLYLANDFAKNIMLRNDNGKLVDATAQTETSDIGFGMGVSWGDYNEDGQLDLYVSNMYSTAGSRITSLIDERLDGNLEDKFGRMARGNSLFQNRGAEESFVKVSGHEPGQLDVEVAGWSWGSQFFDADNDGFLDVYATSGFYTAPPQVEMTEDL